jgi:hypothetical protein
MFNNDRIEKLEREVYVLKSNVALLRQFIELQEIDKTNAAIQRKKLLIEV